MDHHTLRCLLLALQALRWTRMGKEKAIQATRATKEHKWSSHKSLSNRVDFVAWSGLNALDVSLDWLPLLLQWMWCSEYLDAIEGGGWGVFIASNHFLAVGCFCWRWAHGTVRWRTGHVLFTFRCAPRQHTRWGLSDLTVGVVAPDSPVPHRTCPVTSDFAALTSAAHCSSLFTFAVDCWHAVTVAPLAHGTCPVNYRPVWIDKWTHPESSEPKSEPACSVWFVSRGKPIRHQAILRSFLHRYKLTVELVPWKSSRWPRPSDL
jgi:hypothetical protein